MTLTTKAFDALKLFENLSVFILRRIYVHTFISGIPYENDIVQSLKQTLVQWKKLNSFALNISDYDLLELLEYAPFR